MALVSASFSKLFIHFNVSKYLFLHYFSPLIWFFPVLLLEISILFSSTFYNLPLVNPSKDHIIQGNCMPTISCNTWSFFFFCCQMVAIMIMQNRTGCCNKVFGGHIIRKLFCSLFLTCTFKEPPLRHISQLRLHCIFLKDENLRLSLILCHCFSRFL